MFSRLNRKITEGKYPPMMCKFLDAMSAFSHEIHGHCGSTLYPFERMGFRDLQFPPFGFPIAFANCQPALIHIRCGKD